MKILLSIVTVLSIAFAFYVGDGYNKIFGDPDEFAKVKLNEYVNVNFVPLDDPENCVRSPRMKKKKGFWGIYSNNNCDYDISVTFTTTSSGKELRLNGACYENFKRTNYDDCKHGGWDPYYLKRVPKNVYYRVRKGAWN